LHDTDTDTDTDTPESTARAMEKSPENYLILEIMGRGQIGDESRRLCDVSAVVR